MNKAVNMKMEQPDMIFLFLKKKKKIEVIFLSYHKRKLFHLIFFSVSAVSMDNVQSSCLMSLRG